MTDDLVTRLILAADEFIEDSSHGREDAAPVLLRLAADEIERLREERDYLRHELNNETDRYMAMKETNSVHIAEVERLRALITEHGSTGDRMTIAVVIYKGTAKSTVHDVDANSRQVTLTGLRPDPVWRVLIRETGPLTGEARWIEITPTTEIVGCKKRDEVRLSIDQVNA